MSAHESGEDDTVVIHISEKGFEPNNVDIKIGDKIIFENIGSEEHWPASDDHPSHTLYDGTNLKEHCFSEPHSSFDACEPIRSGESWSFVFTKKGVYKYHDHLWPQFSGVITVSNSPEQESQNKNIFSRLVDSSRKILSFISQLFTKNQEQAVSKAEDIGVESYINLKNRLEKIVLESDPREAISALQDESSKDEETLALCHDLLHIIGHAAYDKYGSFKEAIKYQSDFCNSGYIHGLFESYFKSEKNPLTSLNEQCVSSSVGKRQFDIWQCYHGIGHGFMYFTGGDLDKSLQLCDGLQKSESVASCQNGVYMEVFNSEILAKEKSFVSPEDPFFTCQERKTAKGDCYLYVPIYLSYTLGQDFVKMFKECDRAGAYKYACIQGIGSEAIKRNMNNPDNVFALCKHTESRTHQEDCIKGIVSMYINQKASYSAGKNLCKSAPVSYQDICYTTVESKKWLFK